MGYIRVQFGQLRAVNWAMRQQGVMMVMVVMTMVVVAVAVAVGVAVGAIVHESGSKMCSF